ncbi:hypothetical protein V1J52_05345 [Streptomyces sp. TRM 70351]|uniref:hypothetical protein n=1 Tax=Streptomyces sp. TRM 70351 TaxID=3116552 RepID=UPI002E7BF6E9|nr:hypothetical protein [Streptomyces sp. TRM 70351]MEE1927619.1 hypothetical protein [Streptomyces sp. TRM 70351]
MAKDPKAVSADEAAGAGPVPDLSGIGLSALRGLRDARLAAQVDAVLAGPDALIETWFTGPGPEPPPRRR